MDEPVDNVIPLWRDETAASDLIEPAEWLEDLDSPLRSEQSYSAERFIEDDSESDLEFVAPIAQAAELVRRAHESRRLGRGSLPPPDWLPPAA